MAKVCGPKMHLKWVAVQSIRCGINYWYVCSSSIYQFPGAERISHPITFLRNTLKYVLTVEEVKICTQWFPKIDGKA